MTTENNEKRDETNEERFKRLANGRLNKALDAIALLEPLSATATYEYSSDQIEIMIGELHDAVNRVQDAFERGGPAAAKAKSFF